MTNMRMLTSLSLSLSLLHRCYPRCIHRSLHALRSQAVQFETYLKVKLDEQDADLRRIHGEALDQEALSAAQRVQRYVTRGPGIYCAVTVCSLPFAVSIRIHSYIMYILR